MEGLLDTLAKLVFWLALGAGVVFTALHGGAIIWTFRDMRARSRDVLAWIVATLLVALIPLFGLIVYLMLRPRETLAEAYERSLEQEALLQAIEGAGNLPRLRRAGQIGLYPLPGLPHPPQAGLPGLQAPPPTPLGGLPLLRRQRYPSGGGTGRIAGHGSVW